MLVPLLRSTGHSVAPHDCIRVRTLGCLLRLDAKPTPGQRPKRSSVDMAWPPGNFRPGRSRPVASCPVWFRCLRSRAALCLAAPRSAEVCYTRGLKRWTTRAVLSDYAARRRRSGAGLARVGRGRSLLEGGDYCSPIRDGPGIRFGNSTFRKQHVSMVTHRYFTAIRTHGE
jgi:hypothetical protein